MVYTVQSTQIFVIALLVVLPAAAYNQHEDSVNAAEDPVGDVTTLGTNAVSRSDTLDLTGLLLGGNGTHFHATIQVVDLDGARTQGRDFNDYLFHYHYEGQSYRLTVSRSQPATTPQSDVRYFGSIEVLNEATRQYEETPYEPVVLPRESEDAIDLGIPFASIEGVGGLPASPGFSITGIYVRSIAAGDDRGEPLAEGVHINTSSDRMPNQGAVSWAIQHRSFDGEDILVHVARPQRLSNGGANVFAYSIQVSNSGGEPATFEFALQGAPEEWDASLVDDFLEVSPHDTINNTAVIRTRTAHTHGDQVTMQLVTKHLETGKSWTSELSVIFTQPPQPAGHHSTLYLHAARDPIFLQPVAPAQGLRETAPYMNTLLDDENDVQEAVNSEFRDDLRFWRYPLSPGLGIGLDFVLSETVDASFTIEPRDSFAARDVTMWADLKVQSPEIGNRVLARSEPFSVGDVGDPVDVELSLTPTQESDFVQYEPGSNLYFTISYTIDEPRPGFNPESLVIVPGGSLQLPLLEFYDDVPLTSGAGVLLKAPHQAPGHAGVDVAVSMTVSNRLTRANEIHFDARGAEPEWNIRFDPRDIKLGVGAEQIVKIGIHVPEDAKDGDLLRFLVVARDQGHGATAVVPITVLVDEDSTPELFEKSGSKDTPHIAVPMVALALLAVVMFRRRGVA